MGVLIDKLPVKQQVFVREYLVSLNASEAYRKAGYKPDHADVAGPRLLGNVRVSAAIAEAMAERAEKLELKAEDVLRRLWTEATADRTQLTQHRIGSCRYCWGLDHEYQWKTQREFDKTYSDWLAKGEKWHAANPNSEPENLGGFGYRITRDPNPDCPECAGLGHPYTVFADTSKLSEEGRSIFGGVRETKDGLQIVMPDKTKALELVGKHLGMFKDTHEHTGKNGGPIQHAATVKAVIVPAKEAAVITVRKIKSDENEDEEEVEP